MNNERKAWNDANVKQVIDVLIAAGYFCGSEMKGSNGTIELWIGNGRTPVIALQRYAEDSGIEVWVPLTQSGEMKVTVEELQKATTRPADLKLGKEPSIVVNVGARGCGMLCIVFSQRWTRR